MAKGAYSCSSRSCELPQGKEGIKLARPESGQSLLQVITIKQRERSMCQGSTPSLAYLHPFQSRFLISRLSLYKRPLCLFGISASLSSRSYQRKTFREEGGLSRWLFASETQESLQSNSFSHPQVFSNALRQPLKPGHWKNTLETPKGWVRAPQAELGQNPEA